MSAFWKFAVTPNDVPSVELTLLNTRSSYPKNPLTAILSAVPVGLYIPELIS
jgi:hypothetical protein